MKILTSSRKTNGSRRVRFQGDTDTRVEQAHAGELDINAIVRKYQKTGVLPTNALGKYGDFSGVEDFHASQDRILSAHSEFLELPPDLRFRFNNDPGELMEFMNDPSNLEEARELGLAAPAAEEGAKPAKSEPSDEKDPPTAKDGGAGSPNSTVT